MATFSLIIPTRNRPDYLRKAVESVMAQTRVPEEIIVVDDGHEAKVGLARFSSKVVVVDNRQRGPVPARNLGVATARHECIAFLDDDDWLTDPSYFCSIAQLYDQGADFCFADGALIDAAGGGELPFEFPADALSLERDNTILVSAVSYRRALHDTLGYFDESLPFYWDWDWYLRVARAGSALRHLARKVVAIRVHGGNMSGGTTEAARLKGLKDFAKKHGLADLELKNHLSLALERLRLGQAPPGSRT